MDGNMTDHDDDTKLQETEMTEIPSCNNQQLQQQQQSPEIQEQETAQQPQQQQFQQLERQQHQQQHQQLQQQQQQRLQQQQIHQKQEQVQSYVTISESSVSNGVMKENDVFKAFYEKLTCILPTSNILPQLVAERIISIDDEEEITSMKRSQEKASFVLRIIAKSLQASITHSFYVLLVIMEKYGGDVALLANDIRQALGESSGTPSNNITCRECVLKTQPLAKLKARYVKIFRKIKNIIESKQLEIEELKMILNMAHQNDCTVFSTDDTFCKISTINQLFDHINNYCSIYDYELLQIFLESLDECDEAVNLLEEFTEDLKSSILKELDLMPEIKDHPKTFMNGTFTLTIKYTGHNKCTLSTKNMVQRIVIESLKLQKASIIFRGLEEGCIAFVYQISAVVKSYILQYKFTPDGLALLALHDIKCLIVDQTEIPVPLELKIQLDKVVEALSPPEQVGTLSTLRTIFNNIILHPNEDKYRQIKLTGKTFSTKVWQYSGSQELMKMTGWKVESDHIILKDDSQIQVVLAMIFHKLQASTAKTSLLPNATQDDESVKASSKDKEALKKEKESLLLKQLDKLITSVGPEDCKQTLLTLQICFKNIDLHPHNDKYRQIKLNNKAFCRKVWQYPAGEEFMKMCGWVVEDTCIKLKDDSNVQTVLQLLKIRQENVHPKKEFQGVLTCKQFETLTSAVLTENIAEIYRLLQNCGITSAGRVYCEDGSSINLLFAAITTHQSDMVELLVEEYDVDPYMVDCESSNQKPCLFRIFDEASEIFIIGFLTALGCIDICYKMDGYGLLQTAVLTNCLEVVSFLFENYPRMPINYTDDHRRTLLHLAYLSGNLEMVALLMQIGANPTAIDIFGKKPYDYVKGDPKLMDCSKYAQDNRKIHDDPLSIEYNYYIKLLMHGMDPKQAVSLTMDEFTWLKEEKPTRPRRTDREAILTDLVNYFVKKPTCTV